MLLIKAMAETGSHVELWKSLKSMVFKQDALLWNLGLLLGKKRPELGGTWSLRHGTCPISLPAKFPPPPAHSSPFPPNTDYNLLVMTVNVLLDLFCILSNDNALALPCAQQCGAVEKLYGFNIIVELICVEPLLYTVGWKSKYKSAQRASCI